MPDAYEKISIRTAGSTNYSAQMLRQLSLVLAICDFQLPILDFLIIRPKELTKNGVPQRVKT